MRYPWGVSVDTMIPKFMSRKRYNECIQSIKNVKKANIRSAMSSDSVSVVGLSRAFVFSEKGVDRCGWWELV
jgi:hypothetical protein